MATKESYIVTFYLDRDPGVADEELVRSLSDWKRMKDEGRNPPKWNKETPTTLEGFVRLLMLNGPHTTLGTPGGDYSLMPCVAIFQAPAAWTSILAQALSFMAFGLRPGSYLDVVRSKTTAKDAGVCVSHRRFEIVRNGDGEPEVEEVRVDA